MAFDWLVRVYTPAWLDLLPACATDATALRALASIQDLASARAAAPACEVAEQHASAAESAAWSALTPTRDQVQLLALDLVARMIAVTPETLPEGWIAPSTLEAAAS